MKIVVKRFYNLRCKQNEKVEDAKRGSLTVFVNQAHTIAHGIICEEPEMTIRLQVARWLKHCSDDYVLKYFQTRMHYLFPEKVRKTKVKFPKMSEFNSERSGKIWSTKWKNLQK